MRKSIFIPVLLLAAVLLLSACSVSQTELKMKAPKYTGEDVNGFPTFSLSWSRFSNVRLYEIAFYTDMEDYSGRTTKVTKDAQMDIKLLDGVYTDTVRYRFKARAIMQTGKVSDWSNVCEVNYINGEYTISDNAEEFDTVKHVVNRTGSAKKTEPLPHTFPEALSAFAAKEKGINDYDLSKTATVCVQVNHCEYGEPLQTITDASIVENIVNALAKMTVTGKHDSVSSTETYYIYSLYDADDKSICSFSFQKGFLMMNDGRYDVTDLNELLACPGVMLEEEWSEYWTEYNLRIKALEEEYEEKVLDRAQFPENPLRLSGFRANALYEHLEDADVRSVTIFVEYATDKRYTSEDPAEIRAVLDAVNKAQVGRDRTAGHSGQKWGIKFSYVLPDGTEDEATISFIGDYLETEDENSTQRDVTGLEDILKSVENETTDYLLRKRNQRHPNPIF